MLTPDVLIERKQHPASWIERQFLKIISLLAIGKLFILCHLQTAEFIDPTRYAARNFSLSLTGMPFGAKESNFVIGVYRKGVGDYDTFAQWRW